MDALGFVVGLFIMVWFFSFMCGAKWAEELRGLLVYKITRSSTFAVFDELFGVLLFIFFFVFVPGLLIAMLLGWTE